MNNFKMRAAAPGPGPAARILKMFISRENTEGGDPPPPPLPPNLTHPLWYNHMYVSGHACKPDWAYTCSQFPR